MSTATQSEKHPLIALWARYRAIFGEAWKARHELAGPARLADEAAFLPAAMSLQETPVHPSPRRAMWIFMALFSLALVWSIVGEVDIVAVAPGRIVVSDRSKVIQPLEPAVVRAIHVKDGDRVKAGQVLIELDPTVASADSASVAEQLRAAESEAARTRALLTALSSGSGPGPRLAGASTETMALLTAEWNDIQAKRAKLAAEVARREAEQATAREQLAKLQATLPLARQREADFKALADQGFVAGHAGQDRTRERIEQERDLATLQAKMMEVGAALEESKHSANAYQAETTRGLRDRGAQAETKAVQLRQEGAKTAQRAQLTALRAPVDGVVQQLAIHTTGGVVTAAQTLMVVVPQDGDISAEVLVDNKDIGFVREGQDAEIKLETFGFTRYGTVPAKVSTVSADALHDEKRGMVFAAVLTLSSNSISIDGRPVRFGPGLNLTAEISTGRRRLIHYLLDPVKRTASESMTER